MVRHASFQRVGVGERTRREVRRDSTPLITPRNPLRQLSRPRGSRRFASPDCSGFARSKDPANIRFLAVWPRPSHSVNDLSCESPAQSGVRAGRGIDYDRQPPPFALWVTRRGAIDRHFTEISVAFLHYVGRISGALAWKELVVIGGCWGAPRAASRLRAPAHGHESSTMANSRRTGYESRPGTP